MLLLRKKEIMFSQRDLILMADAAIRQRVCLSRRYSGNLVLIQAYRCVEIDRCSKMCMERHLCEVRLHISCIHTDSVLYTDNK